jgi:hypothetical protein
MPSVVPLRTVADTDDPESFTWELIAQVDGTEMSMVLDTGKARTQLVGDHKGDPSISRGVLGGATVSSRRVGAMRVGAHTVHDLLVDVVPPEAPGARSLLALDVLARQVFELSPARGTLSWGTSPPELTWGVHRDPTGHARVRVAVPHSDFDVWAVLDTGAGITIVDRELADTHRALFERHGHALGTDASGTTVPTPTAYMSPCRLGDASSGVDLGAQRVAFTSLAQATSHLDEPVHMILGTPALSQAGWWFDYAAGRMGCAAT